MAGGAASELSRGGMRTKIEAARIATSAGAHMVIADGRVAHPIARVAEGGRCTWFLTPSNPIAARKVWIGGSLELKGAVFVDAGAAPRWRAAKASCRRGSRASRACSRAAIASPSATSAGPRSGAGSSPMTPCTPSASAAAIRATSRISSGRRPRRNDPSRRHGALRALSGAWRVAPFGTGRARPPRISRHGACPRRCPTPRPD